MWKMSIQYTVPGFEPTTFGSTGFLPGTLSSLSDPDFTESLNLGTGPGINYTWKIIH